MGPNLEPAIFPLEVFTASVFGRESANFCKGVLNLLQLGDIVFGCTLLKGVAITNSAINYIALATKI